MNHQLNLCICILTIMLFSCQDDSLLDSPDGGTDATRVLLDSKILDSSAADIHIFDFTFPDAYVDPCLNVTSSSENFCDCKPQCCQRQMWYCPPNGLGVQAATVVMNICNDSFDICDRTQDLTCPPNEILSRGNCNTILQCPPGIENDIRITVRCEVEGVEGEQQILCSKGNIEYGECIICTPGEERCNYKDDDCDGLVDEEQRNECDACGPVPAEICDNIDNDCDDQTDEALARPCETACGLGIEVCSIGNWISCSAKQPLEEECDGEDNDCDGQIDEGLNCLCTVEDVGNLVPCFENPLLCGQGFKTCECVDDDCTEMRMTDCAALCTYLPGPRPPECDPTIGIILQTEECNNFDEDCDQAVDEGLIQACYTGEPDTLFVGVCSSGEMYCSRGVWGNDANEAFQPGFCLGEVTPQEEICDGADNDCDGVVDYGEEIRKTDILFIVDWSGSMDDEIEAVKIALNRFSTHFRAEEPLQWGLVVGPKELIEDEDETLVLVSNIAPFEQFLASFSALGDEGMDTGSEMLLDGVYLAVQNISPSANIDLAQTVWWKNTASLPEKERFVVNWRNDSDRIIIVFSDEEEQSFLREIDSPNGPERPITRELVEQVVSDSISLRLYTFSTPFSGNWDDISAAGNGANFELTSDALSMYNDLMSIIDEACLPREEQQAEEEQALRMSLPSETRYIFASELMCF